MKEKTFIIIQARLGSTRLPGKILKEINGKSLLEILLLRLEKVKGIAGICVATTEHENDDKVEDHVKKLGYPCFRGSTNDVLDRYYQSAKKLNAKTIIRVTSDCPIFSSEVLTEGLDTFVKNSLSYASNVQPPTYPDGLDYSIFSFELLEQAWKSAQLKSEREHVVPWMWKNISYDSSAKFYAQNLKAQKDISQYRWTVDEPEDFEYISNIYKYFNYDFLVDWKKVLEKIDKIPSRNSHLNRDEGLVKSEQEDKIL
jgi:spore coat polysaccharide biosynthesis protein SpsF (cytidylyltransferase family)